MAEYRQQIRTPQPLVEGELIRMVGLTLEAAGCQAPIGSCCRVAVEHGTDIFAEVVGFSGDRLYLMPIGDIRGIRPGARVIPLGQPSEVFVGDALLGRVVNGAGHPIDGNGPIDGEIHVPLLGQTTNPLQRKPIREPLDTGVRAINSLLTLGRGQRIGLFAGSGVGKSTLLGMMTRYTNADVVVVGLIGERGREVQEFVAEILGPQGMQRAVVVAAPADDSPLMRMHGAWRATAIAEYFRAQGLNVLLLMDSLTRFAQAQREIALAIGEPPVTKGYPPSVFAKLPQLVERAGNTASGGTMTAVYTVLVDGDDHNDPVADAARAILDGHIVLSRQIAESGRYPAIDVEASISRIMPSIVDANNLQLARRFKAIYSTYEQNRDLISVGAYQPGSDPRIDQAIRCQPMLETFLTQEVNQPVAIGDSQQQLQQLSGQWQQVAEEGQQP
ncbi:MAG: flagellar protein export ATPase FliI [Porticoccaceae bacterium]|nr:flagellar protein export ATPase FliI [Porticoccaceae bacterium]